jgi:transposase
MEKKTDLRRLKHSELTVFREQAMKRIQSGVTVEEVCKGMGVSRSALFGWLARYRNGGWGALYAGKRGGRRPKLDGDKLKWIYGAVVDKDPSQMKFPFALWTAVLVAELIRREFGIKLSRWSVMRLLRQLGLSPQKPLQRAYQQNPEAVEQWKSEVYPRIAAEAKKVGATVYFGDESSIRSDYHTGTTWAPKGKTPVVRTTGARFSVNMIAAISARGVIRFMTYKGTMNACLLKDFLSRLLKDSDGPVFLVLDGHPVHRSAEVRKYVESTDGKLRLFFLPGYSPELNPVEQTWNYTKRHNIGKRTIKGPDHLKRLAIGALRKLQKLPDIIRGFFRHPECAYAAG